MDSNNPVTPNPAPQPTPPAAEENKGSNKLILWFVIGLVIVVVAVGGIYLFLSRQQAAGPTPPAAGQAAKTQTPKPTPAENLESDLNSIDVESDADLTEIDQDLQAL